MICQIEPDDLRNLDLPRITPAALDEFIKTLKAEGKNPWYYGDIDDIENPPEGANCLTICCECGNIWWETDRHPTWKPANGERTYHYACMLFRYRREPL